MEKDIRYRIKIKAFRAVDEPELCEEFTLNYGGVLKSYGIESKSFTDTTWYSSSDVYVITATDKVTNRMIGGARIEVANNDYQLPIEKAIGGMDPGIYDLVHSSQFQNTSEICRLWNLREISGSGLSSIIISSCMAEAAIAISKQLNLKSMIELCSPWTLGLFKRLGFSCATSIGNQGVFTFPRSDLEATVMYLRDIRQLQEAGERERERILNLIAQPKQHIVEQGLNGDIDIEYDLDIF